jgi:hypothetical protein
VTRLRGSTRSARRTVVAKDGGVDTASTDTEGRRTATRWPSRLSLAALVTLVALITGAVNLAYLFWPDLKRDPGIENAAELTVLTMDRNVSYGAYRGRPGVTPPDPAPSDAVVGNVFYLQMEMRGFKGRAARLRWFTYNAENGDRLRRPFSTGHTFKAKAPTNKSISAEWVQLPRDSGTYLIRFELYDGNDVLLAFADSLKFTTRVIPSGP